MKNILFLLIMALGFGVFLLIYNIFLLLPLWVDIALFIIASIKINNKFLEEK